MTATQNESPPSRVPWPPLLFITVVVLGRVLDHILPGPILPTSLGEAAGVVIIALALANDVWCALTLRRHRTTVLPHRAVSALVTSGPYVRSRNPIYVSELALALGLALLLSSFWLLALSPLLLIALTKLAIEREERHLRAKFGADFEAYAARTPRWL